MSLRGGCGAEQGKGAVLVPADELRETLRKNQMLLTLFHGRRQVVEEDRNLHVECVRVSECE